MKREKYLVCIKRTTVSAWECVGICQLFLDAARECDRIQDKHFDAGVISDRDAVRFNVVPSEPAPYGWELVGA